MTMDALLQIEPIEDFRTVANDVLESLHCTTSSIRNNVTQLAKEELQSFIKLNSFNIDQMTDTLRNRGDEEKVNYLISQLKERKMELLYKTLINYKTSYGECVTNFDWTVKLVLGTSAMKTLKYPFLQLFLCSTTKDGTQTKTIYEMKKCVLSKMIIDLENMKLN